MSWPEHSIPQVAEPFTRNGRQYLLEVDEFANFGLDGGVDQSAAPVGAARIIDIADPRHPKVVSNLRLQVHQPGAARATSQRPGRAEPGAGVHRPLLLGAHAGGPEARGVLDDRVRPAGVRHQQRGRPGEVGYFNKPMAPGTKPTNPEAQGGYAMSQPAWDVKRRQVWYTDGNSGFYVVGLTNGPARLLGG